MCIHGHILKVHLGIEFSTKRLKLISDISIFYALDCFCSLTALRSDVVQFKLSDIGEGIAEVTVKEW